MTPITMSATRTTPTWARRCRCALMLALLVPAMALAQSPPPTSPTYNTHADLDVVRGNQIQRQGGAAVGSGYKGQGATGASAGAGPLGWAGSADSEATAGANDRQLRATAVAAGELFSLPPGQLPHVSALARAETMRFFHFNQDMVLENIPALLGGNLGGHIAYAEQVLHNFARLHYSLVWTDAQGQALATIFGVDATLSYLGGFNFDLLRRTSGLATQNAFEQGFSPTTLDGAGPFGPTQAWRIGYLEDIDTPLVAQANQLYGFRWVLEAEALIEGNALAGLFDSDFGFTADIGLGLSDAELAARGIVEVLALPAGNVVAEPATAALVMLALVGLLGVRQTAPWLMRPAGCRLRTDRVARSA